MEREDEIGTVPRWKAQQRARSSVASRSVTVTEHCRLTFQVDQTNAEIVGLDCGDCRYEAAMMAMEGMRMRNPAHPGDL